MTVWLGLLTLFVLGAFVVFALVLKWLWEDTRKVCDYTKHLEEQIDVLQKQAAANSQIFSEFFQATADLVNVQSAAIQRLVQPTNKEDLN